MKILHIIDTFAPGGAQTMVILLCIKMQCVNHEIIALHGNGESDYEKDLKNAGVNVRLLASSKYKIIKIVVGLLKELRRKDFDIIHLHLRASTFIGCTICKLFKIRPVIVTIYEQKYQHPRTYRIFAWLSSIITHYVGVSEIDRDDLINLGINKNKVSYAFPPININGASTEYDRVRTALNRQYNIPSEFKLLLSLARLNKDRQIHKLIDCLELLTKKNSNIIMLIVGDGPERKNMEAAVAKKNLTKYVIFAGQRIDRWDLLPGCDIYLSASADSYLGLAGVEAMACSRPVVAYNLRPMNIDEILYECRGLFITTRDPAAMSKAILRLIDNSIEADDLGKKARENVIRTVSLNDYIQKYEHLYFGLVKEGI